MKIINILLFLLLFPLFLEADGSDIIANKCQKIKDDNKKTKIEFEVKVANGDFDLASLSLNWSGNPTTLDGKKIKLETKKEEKCEVTFNSYQSGDLINFSNCTLKDTKKYKVKIKFDADTGFAKNQEITINFNEKDADTSSVKIWKKDNKKKCSMEGVFDTPEAIASYRFDECIWNGTSGEVKDSSGTDRNATAYNATTTSNSKLYKAGDFTATADDYLSLPKEVLDGVDDLTFVVWLSIPQTTDQNYIISAINDKGKDTFNFRIKESKSDEDTLWVKINGKIKTFTLKNENKIIGQGWKQFAFTLSDKKGTVYVNGNKTEHKNENGWNDSLTIKDNRLIFGQKIKNNGDLVANENLKGYADEVLFFDSPLTESQIQDIYTNINNGYNYDGSDREVFFCPNDLVAEYRFEACDWNSTAGEIKDETGTYNASKTADDIIPESGWLNNGASFLSENNISDIHAIDMGITPMDIGNEGTISFWFKSNTKWDEGEGRTLIDASARDADDPGTAEDKYFFLALTNEGKIRFYLEDKDDKDFQSSSNDKFTYAADEWVHIAISWKLGTQYKLYINGEEKSLDIGSNQALTEFGGLDTIHIGDIILDYIKNGRENSANGIFDEFKIYRSALAGSQIQEIYDNENSKKNYDGSQRDKITCSVPSPVAEYRFDACQWEDNAGDVLDSGPHAYHARTHHGTQPTQTLSVLNNGAHFTGADWDNATTIETSEKIIDTQHNFSITFWMNVNAIDTSETWTGVLSKKVEFYITKEKQIHINMKNQPNQESFESAENIFDTEEWHHIAIVSRGRNIKLYLDGNVVVNELMTKDKNPDDLGLLLGKTDWEGAPAFNGNLDELKLFKSILSPTQVKTIYNNEYAHYNYDGSHRMAIDCITPVLLAEYRFDECKYNGATGEVTDSIGGDNSGTITGDANISKTEKKVGHALKLNGGAVDIDNLAVSTEPYKKNTVMFWMYWNGNNGIMPFGWNKYDLWLPNGSFGFNSAAGDLYGISSSGLANGWHHVTAVFTNNDMYSNRLYIDGVLQTLSQRRKTPNNNSALCTSYARIGGWRVNDGYRFKTYLDELKIYKGEVNATTIKGIFDSEKDLVRTITCAQAIFNAVNQNGGCFNWDNNITTQIAGDPIRLTILSADQNDANTTLQDANITKLELMSFSDVTCNTLYDVQEIWSGNTAVDSNGCWNPVDIIHNKAIRCAKIRITGIFEGSQVESNSTDTFSIRPKSYILQNIPTGKLTAEHTYTFKAVAVNSDGSTQTPDYNTTVTPESNKYFRDGSDGSSMAGTFSPTADFTFTDGATADTSLSFNNVGIIGLDLNDTNWSITDADDTPLVDRTIYLEQNLTFIPAKFKIDFPTTPVMKNYNDGSFTYYANDLTTMYASLRNLSFTVTALGENDTVMTNYQNPQTIYFANNSNFTLGLAVEQNPNLSNDINESSTRDLNFTDGIATLNYNDVTFNFTREHNVTREPLIMQGGNSQIQINIADNVDVSVEGNKTQAFAESAIFYYGRMITNDLRTADTPAPNKVSFAIYSTTILNGFERYTQNWYINKLDHFSNWQSATPKTNRKLSSDTQSSASISNEAVTSEGIKSFDLVANPSDKAFKAFFHLDIPAWLWYSKYEGYDFGVTSSCASHPCFAYIFDHDDQGVGIASGSFKGASFDHNITSTPKRKAVKLLR